MPYYQSIRVAEHLVFHLNAVRIPVKIIKRLFIYFLEVSDHLLNVLLYVRLLI
jgi:hypothetical protein